MFTIDDRYGKAFHAKRCQFVTDAVCRYTMPDMTAIMFIFEIFSIPTHFIFGTDWRLFICYEAILASIYLLIVGGARTLAASMVTNVLAEESSGGA